MTADTIHVFPTETPVQLPFTDFKNIPIANIAEEEKEEEEGLVEFKCYPILMLLL